MEQKRRGRVVFQSGSVVLKIVVMVLIVFSMTALLALRWVHTGIQAEIGDMRDKAASLEQQNADLLEKTGELGSVKSVEEIAQSELGLVNPDTVVISVETSEPTE